MEDQELIKKFLKGDQSSFDELVLRHQVTVRQFIFSATKNEADTDDIAQDVFIKVYHQLHRFRGDSSFATWLYRISSNMLTDHFRRHKYRDYLSLDQVAEPAADDEPDKHQSDLRTWLLDRLPRLTKTEHQVVILHSLQDLPVATVAEIMGTSQNVVKVSFHRAKRKLKRWVDND